MRDKEKKQCVICHKDITSELPKIDIYGNYYCKDCYIEKCKYELMNMRDTILINKEFLKRELQYLEEQTRKHTQKETAQDIFDTLLLFLDGETFTVGKELKKVKKKIIKMAKEMGVDLLYEELF